MLTTRPAEVHFAAGMCAAGAFDRRGSVFVAIHVVEGGVAVLTRSVHKGLLDSVPEVTKLLNQCGDIRVM